MYRLQGAAGYHKNVDASQPQNAAQYLSTRTPQPITCSRLAVIRHSPLAVKKEPSWRLPVVYLLDITSLEYIFLVLPLVCMRVITQQPIARCKGCQILVVDRAVYALQKSHLRENTFVYQPCIVAWLYI